MQALLALVPCAVVIAGVLGARWSGLAAAAASLVATAVLVGVGAFKPAHAAMAGDAIADAMLLTVLVSATLVPGVLFIEATRRLGSPQAITRAVELLRLPQPQTAVLLSLGVGVLVESLTGMGVSLLLTVPMLLVVLPRTAAIAVALVGMSLMPWGALALAGTVGATLAGIEPGHFGWAIWCFSGVVAAVLPLVATRIAGGKTFADVHIAIFCGGVLAAATGLATLAFGMSLAGVAGGLAILAVLGMRAERSPQLAIALRASPLTPYLVLIAAVCVQTVGVQYLTWRGVTPTLTTGRVTFAILTSPGVALTLATVLTGRRALDARLGYDVLRRSWRAVASVALFMLTARLLVASGGIDALTAAIKGFGPIGALAAVTGLGALGGFVTGSGVTGNALFLPSAAEAGAAIGAKDVFAAVASAAAGHAAMASLPVAALLLTALPDRAVNDDRVALKWGLLLTAGYLCILLLVGALWLTRLQVRHALE